MLDSGLRRNDAYEVKCLHPGEGREPVMQNIDTGVFT